MTDTINTLKLLGRLAELVEIWEEPEDSGLKKEQYLKNLGWKEQFKNYTYVFSIHEHQNLDDEEAWNHEITQTAFKKEVREVCLELAKDYPIKEYIGQSSVRHRVTNWSLEDLLKDISQNFGWGAITSMEAICQKLGTSLDKEIS